MFKTTLRPVSGPLAIRLVRPSSILKANIAATSQSIKCIRHSSSSSSSSSSSAPPPPKQEKIPLGVRISHAVSFSFYSGLVLVGVGLTGVVIYYFVHDILLPTSDVQVFTRARHLIEKDPECQKLLGSSKLKAYGERTGNKWTRNRPIASKRGYDANGKEHLLMEFHVEGPLGEGLVRLEMIQSEEKNHAGIGTFDFRYLVLETPGNSRVYVIDNTPKIQSSRKRNWLPTGRTPEPGTGFLGVKWGKSKDE